jgi:hypothetical protein
MYALSVKQPHASRIAIGQKTIEWRSRPFKYRGPLVICASKSPKIKIDSGHFLPAAAAIAIVDVVDCRPISKADLQAACALDYLEYIFGPPEGWAWILANPREVAPTPVKGIVAPWPWKGPELIECPGWHEQHIGFTSATKI